MKPHQKPGGVRLTPAELRYVFMRHDTREAVSWHLGYLVAVLLGAGALRLHPWALVVLVGYYVVTAIKAYLRWRTMEKQDTAA